MRRFRLPTLGLAIAAAACGASAPALSTPRSSETVVTESPDAASTPTDLSPGADVGTEAETLTSVDASAGSASTTLPDARATSPESCNEQSPQDFLVRSTFLKGGQDAIQRAIQYRTDTYGYFKGFGRAGADAQSPSTYVVSTTFMDLPIKMHRKVVPALQCVEEEIKRTCARHPYTPHALAGIRYKNTYRGGEVTNHIYGIAIDIDPGQNSCCGCVKPWNEAPICKRPAKTEYDRMAMPECWVHGFERYGFYWLGHDVLRDTMHFEFLGDPDRILRSAPGRPAAPLDGGS
ncbi:MAG: M15 family metallopeptidase [Myxococcota bacterium]|nr:M15 family metallopeptidase [Myxococcota bacterium]